MFNFGCEGQWSWVINLIIVLIVFEFLMQILCGDCVCNGHDNNVCGC